MKKKLYQVGFGMIEEGTEHLNVDKLSVVAIDAEGAIKKAKKRKNYFVQYVSFVSEIDKI
jgi:tRNA-binding EMAP/Myf-like protein